MKLSLNQKKILIVEDDDAFDLWIGLVLARLEIVDYQRVKTVEEALVYLENQSPDLIISDIFLEGILTGVDFLKKIQQFSVPIIIITSSTSISLYREVQQIEHVVYLVKPFQPVTFIGAIENLLLGNINTNSTRLKESSFFVRMPNNKHEKVYLSDILYIESDGNYTYLFTSEKKIALKKSITKVLTELDKRFIRCHKTYAVNKHHIVSWSSTQIRLKNSNIPIGRSYQKLFEQEISTSGNNYINESMD